MIVYKAEQPANPSAESSPQSHQARHGYERKEVVARFESERQALAMLSHPNGRPRLEAGITRQRTPFFAMEHVPAFRGPDYCHRINSGTRGSGLELFIPVMPSIQHAHQKGSVMSRSETVECLVAES